MARAGFVGRLRPGRLQRGRDEFQQCFRQMVRRGALNVPRKECLQERLRARREPERPALGVDLAQAAGSVPGMQSFRLAGGLHPPGGVRLVVRLEQMRTQQIEHRAILLGKIAPLPVERRYHRDRRAVVHRHADAAVATDPAEDLVVDAQGPVLAQAHEVGHFYRARVARPPDVGRRRVLVQVTLLNLRARPLGDRRREEKSVPESLAQVHEREGRKFAVE